MVDNEPVVVPLLEAATVEVEATDTARTDIIVDEMIGTVEIGTVAIRIIVHPKLQTRVGTKEEN